MHAPDRPAKNNPKLTQEQYDAYFLVAYKSAQKQARFASRHNPLLEDALMTRAMNRCIEALNNFDPALAGENLRHSWHKTCQRFGKFGISRGLRSAFRTARWAQEALTLADPVESPVLFPSQPEPSAPASLLQEEFKTAVQSCLKTLSPREKQVIEMIMTGIDAKKIQKQLGVKGSTIRAQRDSAYKKISAMMALVYPDLLDTRAIGKKQETRAPALGQ